jgi:serine/threonine protein kinase
MPDKNDVFGEGEDSGRDKSASFNRQKWRAEEVQEKPEPNEHFVKGKTVKNGLCQIEGHIGSGGMSQIFSTQLTDNTDWEDFRLHLLQGDIEQMWEYTQITSDDVFDGVEPAPQQMEKVDEVVARFKSQYGDKFPKELMVYVDEKLRQSPAVIKVLIPKYDDDGQEHRDSVVRAQQEAYVMKYDLDHPNIIDVFHYFVEDGYHCILEESFEGAKSLDTVLEDRGVSKEQAARIGSAVFKAISHSHDKGIIWRDCKPENILVDDDIETIKATDWGIAKKIRGHGIELLLDDTTTQKDASITKEGHIAATPYYASPEQMLNPDSIGKETDYFSLGSTLYKAVTGKLAFSNEMFSRFNRLFELSSKDPTAILSLVITSPDPELMPEFPNLAIERERQAAEQNRKIRGVSSAAPHPVYVSEEFEDLVMMLLEKDPKKRVRSEYIGAVFGHIHENKLYEKKELSPEEAKHRDIEIENILSNASKLEQGLSEISEGEQKAKILLEVARAYDDAAQLIPRVVGEDTLPEFSRRDAFGKAIEHYKELLKYNSIVPDEQIGERIHDLECRCRIEFAREDQMRLLKKGEKVAKKEPQSMHRLRGTGYVLSKLDSALLFLEKGMFVAARKEWDDAESYSTKNKVSGNAYLQMKQFKENLLFAKQKANYEHSVEISLETIQRLIEMRRFNDANTEIERTYQEIENNTIFERSKSFREQVTQLMKFNDSSKEEYEKFQEIARALGVEKDNYKAIRADLLSGSFFPKSVLEDAAWQTETVWQEYQSLDKVRAGESHCAELESTFEEMRKTYKDLSLQLARMTFAEANEKLKEISGLNAQLAQLGKCSPEAMEKITQAEEAIKYLEGETGISNIQTGKGFIPEERIKQLRKMLKTENERFWMLSEDVRYFESLKSKAENGSDDEKVEACKSLVFTYILEEGALDKAMEYFDKMPEFAKNRDDSRTMEAETFPMTFAFEAYRRIREESMFPRKTPDGLDEKVVNHLGYLGGEQISKLTEKSERNDPAFDTELKLVCRYTGTDPEAVIAIRNDIDQTYESMNRLNAEMQGLQSQPEQYSEKQGQITGLNAHLKQQEGNYAAAIGAIVESAKKKIETEGTRKPEDPMDYVRVATFLRDLAKDHKSAPVISLSRELYVKYMKWVPENSEEANIARQNIAYLDSLV